MKLFLGALVAAVLVVVSSAMAAPDNPNATSYTATCMGFEEEAISVRIERSLLASPNSGAGVAFHVVPGNQVVLFAGTPGLEAQAAEAGTICTVTAINGETLDEPFLAPIVIIEGHA